MGTEHDIGTKTILLVEDDPWLEKLVAVTIARGDFRLVNARDGEEAVTAATKEKPDLILLDVNLPKMDGFEVCRFLKAQSDLSYIPVIFLTAKSDPEDIKEGMDAGGTAYITKPFSPLKLLATIEDILNKSKKS